MLQVLKKKTPKRYGSFEHPIHTGKCIHRFAGIYYRLQSFLSIQYIHGDLCKHLGIDSSTNRISMWHMACFFYIVFTPISTTSGL